jgi:hypothetical protein
MSAAGLALAGCASMPKTDGFTQKSMAAGSSAYDQAAQGLPGAAQAPFRDLNLVHDAVPPILVRAYARPYDNAGLDSCPAILEQVHQLDLALGPDVDIPLGATPEKDMFAKGAGFAADAALDAAKAATTGFIPLRSWVRRLSGANRAEQQAKAVALAGSVRRGYLKAIGQQRGCDWPAAPLKPGSPEAQRVAASVQAAASKPTPTPPATPQR